MEIITYRFFEISKLYSGGDAPKEVSPIRTEEYCYPIYSNGIVDDGLYGYGKKATMKAGTLTVSARGTIGDVFYRKERFLPIVRLITIEPDESFVDTKYLYYYLKQNKLEGFGTSQQQLTIPFMRKRKILVFKDVSYQRLVASLLNKYDELIEINLKKIEVLEKTVEQLYKEWFVRFRFPGFKNTKFINGIPEKWSFIKFSDVCPFDRGISYSSEQIENEDAPNLLINLKNLRDYGGFRKENYKKYDGDYKPEHIVKKFDLVMAITEMVQERRIIGYAGLVPTYKDNCVISADLIRIKSKLNNLFLYSMFTYGGVSLCFSQYGNGTNVIHLKPKSLRNIKLLIPDSTLINKYVKIVENYFETIDSLQLQDELLAQKRDSLIPRLLSGKLSVEGKEIV